MINKVLFIGSKPLGLQCLAAMYKVAPESITGVITLDDSADVRTAFNEFKHFCSINQIPLYVAANKKETEQQIRKWDPECCFVVGWYWLFSAEILESVPSGFLGIHNSLLPLYRGSSPLVWSIINGEKEVGFSLFSFTAGMDDGKIWVQKSIELEPDMHIGEALKALEGLAVNAIEENYANILLNNIIPENQDESKATYCALRGPEDGRINWNWPAAYIYNFIRAQSDPYPGAFSFYNEHKVIIKEAEVCGVYYGAPGQIGRFMKDGVVVVTGDFKGLLIKNIKDEANEDFISKIKSIKVRLQ